MGRKTTSQSIYPVASLSDRHRRLASSGSERKPALRPSRAETLIVVLFLSLGLWALIWGGVSLLAGCALG
jgi:hypothetical protein